MEGSDEDLRLSEIKQKLGLVFAPAQLYVSEVGQEQIPTKSNASEWRCDLEDPADVFLNLPRMAAESNVIDV